MLTLRKLKQKRREFLDFRRTGRIEEREKK